MVRASKEVRTEIIENVVKHVREKLHAKQAPFVEQFVRQYFNLVSTEDLKSRNEIDLYGAALSHLLFLNQHKTNELSVRVYNPQYEQHGWQSPHTIVEIAHPEIPFLVDSVRQEIVRHGLTVHLLIYPGTIYVKRDTTGRISGVFNEDEAASDASISHECPLYVEIDKQTDQKALQKLQDDLTRVLSDVRVAVNDWALMREKAHEMVAELKSCGAEVDPVELRESIDFIDWLAADNFTFLGCRDYALASEGGRDVFKLIPGSGLGLLREDRPSSGIGRSFSVLALEGEKLAPEQQKVLIISKSNCRSTVHRTAYMDYVAVKRFDVTGRLLGKRYLVGLYTANAYNSSPRSIPFLRRKVLSILEKSGFSEKGHSEKELLNVLETFPRDDLFQGDVDELTDICVGILHLQERRKIRLFMRKDVYGRFFSCLVYVPKELFNSELRDRFGSLLMKALNGSEINYATQFSESILARIHFIVRLSVNAQFPEFDVEDLEKKLVAAGRTWQDDLREVLSEHSGEEKGNILFTRYGHAFPAGYRERYTPKTAVYDVEHIEKLENDESLAMSFYRPLEEAEGHIRFKLFRRHAPLPLSDVMPILENMGMRVLSEHSYELLLKDATSIWINDFEMVHHLGIDLDVDKMRLPFQECFYKLWINEVENDALNRLILNADLSWRETSILRAYSKYFRQIGFTFSLNYIHDTLNRNPQVASELVALFKVRFDFKKRKRAEERMQEIQRHIEESLEHVSNLDEDRILRRYLDVILATVRTNYYQKDSQGSFKNYLSFKLLPSQIPEIPLPRPMFEIFVYSPFVEGVHLRAAKVARGGLRWSDRREDYRTEILGLMKAQQVKNSVIVPAGAKGGFVPQNLPADGTREEIMTEVIRCYSTFIRGLLDLTDNLKDRQVIPPPEVVRLDEDDPYLVVAADKGTATFSDIANAISIEYGFWLGDAFASGGSSGYDHKKMGITARGAWESVKRHFHEINLDVQTQNFTVLGIGDMSGDVFGNGMLQSRHIQLIAAFNHQHIFLDPNPESEASFLERERLFNLPRSSWTDYSEAVISRGGGVFKRSAKSIKISPEVKERFGLNKDVFVPNELIKALLQSRFDLLWNGGIGTYVKASDETHADAGDRSNDAVRVDGRDLQCRVVGEGGNLGFTQLSRVEYSLKGGIGFTDFIDNAGGVNCSDHEVNIKILLDDVVRSGDLTEKQRNQFLEAMTQEVGKLVIDDNYSQTRAISLAASRAQQTLDEHRLFIYELERMGHLDRALEYLPNEEELNERKANGQGLTRPEISILFAYSKIFLKEELLNSDLPEDRSVLCELESEFPKALQEKFYNEMLNHKLKREIIATRLSSSIINTMGFTFIKRLYDETGSSCSDIARAFIIARDVFNLTEWYEEIEALNHIVSAEVQQKMMLELVRLLRRITRWLLRNRRMQLKISDLINQFKPQVQFFIQGLPGVIIADEKERFEQEYHTLLEARVPEPLARRMGLTRFMYSALDIIEVAHLNHFEVSDVAAVYFSLGARLELGWFREQINAHPVDDNWDALARAACRDDIDYQQRNIALAVLKFPAPEPTLDAKIAAWSEYHQSLIYRWYAMLTELRATKSKEFTIFSVALRELLDLAQTSQNILVP